MRTEQLDARIAEIDEKLEALPGKRKKEKEEPSEVDARLAELRAEREALEYERREEEKAAALFRLEQERAAQR